MTEPHKMTKKEFVERAMKEKREREKRKAIICSEYVKQQRTKRERRYMSKG